MCADSGHHKLKAMSSAKTHVCRLWVLQTADNLLRDSPCVQTLGITNPSQSAAHQPMCVNSGHRCKVGASRCFSLLVMGGLLSVDPYSVSCERVMIALF
jgi:hypothetical protein